MEQVFRIEIPVEAVDKTDTAALHQLESTLQKIFTAMKQNKTAASDVFDAIERSATEAKAAMNQVESATSKAADSYSEAASAATDAGNKQEQAASNAESATQKLDETVSEVAGAYNETASAATEAGRKSGSAFSQAATGADKFTQRIEKSEKTLRSMFKEKFQLIIAAIDKASPVLKTIWNTTKSLAGKAWSVAVRMKDFITAPFRKLYNTLTSPITLALSVAGIGMSAGEVISTFNEFETGMSAVKALVGATDEEFLLLKQTAKDLGAETAFSASQASEGMQYLASAGWNTNEIVAAMPGLLDLAAAGATELGTAADIVANVMNAMGMAAGEASRTADVFAKTAAASNASIEDLGETLKYAAPIAHSFGMSLEEVSSLAGMMANAGIKGSMAGTAIRSSLMSMASPAKDAATLMRKLGLSFKNADGSMKDMSVIVRDLQGKFAKLTEAQKLSYAETLFGTYASSAWLGVINQGADAYDELTTSLNNAKGAAQEMAKTRLDNLAGDMEALGGAVETAKLELMEKLDPYLRKAVQWLTDKMPQVQATLERAIDTVIGKVTSLKDHLQSVFDSADFKNADGLAEKFFVAWDKIVAEPFAKWWSSGGRDKVLGMLADIGENMGKLLNGVIAGIFAAISGKEIDFEGFNLTGIGKAGAEAAKTFVSSFLGGLDAGGLAGAMPGFLKAGLLGFGAIKAGQGIYGITKTVQALKEAFGGVTGAAATAKVAAAAVGQTAATSAVGIGKASAVLGGLKTVLAAVPVWGWVAAAAIAATAIGIKHYTEAQERHRQELLHMGDGVEKATETYRNSVRQMNEVGDTIQTIREVEIKIKRGGLTTNETTAIQAELAEINSREAWLTVRLSDTSLSKEDITNYKNELKEIKSRKAEIQALLKDGSLTPQEISDYQTELEKLKGREVEVKAALKAGTLTPSEIAEYQAELDKLKGREVELNAQLAANRVTATEVQQYASELAVLKSREEKINMALEKGVTGQQAEEYMRELDIIKSREETISLKLEGLGLTTVGILYAASLVGAIDGKTAEVKIIMGESSLTAAEIKEYTDALAGIYSRKAELDLQLTGASLTAEQVAAYKNNLAGIENRTAEIEAKIAQGGLSADEISKLSAEYQALKTKEATISLMLSGQGLTQEQLGALTEEWEGLETKEAEINAKMAEGGMTEKQIKDVADAMKEIGSKTAMLNVSFATGSLTQEDLEGYNNQLDAMYKKLVELSGGQFTQEDLEAGRLTKEREQQVMDTLRTKEATDLLNLQLEVERGRTTIGAQVQARSGYEAEYQAAQQAQDKLSTARANLMQLESERANLVAQDELNWQRVELGNMSEADYDQWYEGTFMPGMNAIQGRYETDVVPYAVDANGNHVISPLSPYFHNLLGDDAFTDLIDTLMQAERSAAEQTAASKGVYDTQNASLLKQYQGEKALIEGQTFQGTQLAGMSLEEVAASYATLDDAGRQMFEDAVLALNTLNAQVDYLSEGEKTQATDVVDLAAKAEVMQNIQTQVQSIADNYAGMTDEQRAAFEASEEGVAALANVNSALESIGADKIENLSQINTALETLSTIDLSTFSLANAQAAFSALSGEASGLKTNVDSLRSSLNNLDGTKATVTITTERVTNYTTNGSTVKNANGGIYDGAFLSWVAEDGPEAIIPLSTKRRDRGIDLWLQAGQMLGVAEFAEGGILAPYTGVIENLPDDAWDGGDGNPKPIATGSSGGNTFTISVAANPTFEISGSDSTENILDKLKSKQKELAEILGGALADQLEDIVANMV